MQGIEHELDKRRGIGMAVRHGQHSVVVLLPRPDHRLYGQMRQQWFPVAQDKSLPHSPHAPVAIRERVDELELVVEDGTCHRRMLFGSFQPMEKVGDQVPDAVGGRSHVNRVLAAKKAHDDPPPRD
jgi:hypothetical protein